MFHTHRCNSNIPNRKKGLKGCTMLSYNISNQNISKEVFKSLSYSKKVITTMDQSRVSVKDGLVSISTPREGLSEDCGGL